MRFLIGNQKILKNSLEYSQQRLFSRILHHYFLDVINLIILMKRTHYETSCYAITHPAACHFIPPKFQHSPQYPVLKHQSTLFTLDESSVFTTILKSMRNFFITIILISWCCSIILPLSKQFSTQISTIHSGYTLHSKTYYIPQESVFSCHLAHTS
jgi:hypothetical protein